MFQVIAVNVLNLIEEVSALGASAVIAELSEVGSLKEPEECIVDHP